MKSARKSVLPCLVIFMVLILFSVDVYASVADAQGSEDDPSYPNLRWFDVIRLPLFEMKDDTSGLFETAVFIGDLWISCGTQVESMVEYYESSDIFSLNINRSRFSKRRFKPDNDCEIWQIIFGLSSMIC